MLELVHAETRPAFLRFLTSGDWIVSHRFSVRWRAEKGGTFLTVYNCVVVVRKSQREMKENKGSVIWNKHTHTQSAHDGCMTDSMTAACAAWFVFYFTGSSMSDPPVHIRLSTLTSDLLIAGWAEVHSDLSETITQQWSDAIITVLAGTLKAEWAGQQRVRASLTWRPNKTT